VLPFQTSNLVLIAENGCLSGTFNFAVTSYVFIGGCGSFANFSSCREKLVEQVSEATVETAVPKRLNPYICK